MSLPIDEVQTQFLQHLQNGPVVITAPTGTGKSTQVPRWLLETRDDKILMIQPRRVAARAVAARVAELEQIELGKEVGYRVRDDDCSGTMTRLLVATPGIVLARPELLDEFGLVVLDELHERRLDTDLILALLNRRKTPLVAMSATMDGDAVAKNVGGAHLSVAARTFPVDTHYLEAGAAFPEARDLEKRVQRALAQLKMTEGDILVFLPGRGEIQRVADSLRHSEFEVIELHGSLSLKQQAAALRPGDKRRIILSTNVAETSLTIPGVRTVIDSGLVRRTTYHNGRSYLALSHVALDSADQRAGRAGRVAEGECIRLWGKATRLKVETPPEIHRESLVPLVMLCAALGQRVEALPFLSSPKDYALDDARQRLVELGAITSTPDGDHLTDTGRALSGLPVDPWLSRVLVEARRQNCLEDAIDLVSALEQGGRLNQLASDDDLEHPACDLSALIFAVREAAPRGAAARPLKEARQTARRLRKAFGLADQKETPRTFDRTRLLKTLLLADPVCAHVARTRKKRVVFSNGGTEMDLGRDSRVGRLLESSKPQTEKVDALAVLETRGIASDSRDKKLIITLASAIPMKWLAELSLGHVQIKDAQIAKKGLQKGKLIAIAERTYAGRVIETREEQPEGEQLREAVVALFESGRLHSEASREARLRLNRRALAASLGKTPEFSFFAGSEKPPALKDWLAKHLTDLGVESANDLDLLGPEDFLPEGVPPELAPQLDDRFPFEVDLGDCLYQVEYDLQKKQATLSIVRGHRAKPPPANYLPRFEGLKVFVEAGGNFHAVRR